MPNFLLMYENDIGDKFNSKTWEWVKLKVNVPNSLSIILLKKGDIAQVEVNNTTGNSITLTVEKEKTFEPGSTHNVKCDNPSNCKAVPTYDRPNKRYTVTVTYAWLHAEQAQTPVTVTDKQ